MRARRAPARSVALPLAAAAVFAIPSPTPVPSSLGGSGALHFVPEAPIPGVTIATLRRRGDGMFAGTFVLPDTAVHVVLLVAEGERSAGLDTLTRAAAGAWDLETFRAIADGRLAGGDTAGALAMRARIGDIVRNKRLSEPVFFDRRKAVARAFNSWAVPAYVLIDQTGRLRFLSHTSPDQALLQAAALRQGRRSASASSGRRH